MTAYPFFFTWTAQQDATPLALAGGRGAHFETTDGKRWLDLASLVYSVNAGHGNGRIVEAIKSQAERLCVATPSAVYPEKVALAEELLALAPEGFSKVFFTLGGADANENALKLARLVTGRSKVVARYGAYHGATMGAASLSGDWRRLAVEPGLWGVHHALDWDCAGCPGGRRDQACTHAPLSTIPRLLELEGGDRVAAVFLEAVGGAAGVLIPPQGYMRSVRQACDRHGVLLVCDEVLTGFGRTGRWFAFEHFDGVQPDVITLGKALTSGYAPLGAVLVHERVAAHFDRRTLSTGLTHYGHPLGIAAALEALHVYQEEGLVDRADALGPLMRDSLSALCDAHPGVRRARSIGLLGALEIAAPAPTWRALADGLARRGVYVHVVPRSEAIIVAPPLCIRPEELSEGFDRIAATFTELDL